MKQTECCAWGRISCTFAPCGMSALSYCKWLPAFYSQVSLKAVGPDGMLSAIEKQKGISSLQKLSNIELGWPLQQKILFAKPNI